MSKSATPSQIKRAIVLRESGYSIAAISEKIQLSPSTLVRAFKRHAIGKGDLSAESIAEAKQSLLQDAGFIEELRHTIAASIIDDLAITRKIRESLVMSLEELIDDTSIPAILKARSLAALSTSLSVTQAVQRKALNIDAENHRQLQELPTLTITKMTDEEITAAQNHLKDVDEEE